MKRLLLLIALTAIPAAAQLSPASSSTGSITAAGTTCATTNACVTLHLANSNTGYSVTSSGTFSATLQVEVSGDNQQNWSNATTITTATLFTASTVGITDVRVRCSAFTSGTAVVTITAGGSAVIQNVTQAGGAAAVSSLPATCTPGTTADVRLNVSPYGNFYCATINQWSPYSAVSNSLNPSSFGAKGDVLAIFDGTTTNTSGTVTSAGSAKWCNGTTVACTGTETPDVGKVVVATNCGPVGQQFSGTLAVSTTSTLATITAVNSATSITVSPVASATISGAACVVWGTNDEAAFAALDTYIVNAPDCQSIYLPQRYFVTTAHFIAESSNCTGNPSFAINATDYSMHIYGNGPGVSFIIPLPTFNFATCVASVNGCFFSAISETVRDLSIWGLGNSAVGAGANGKFGIIGNFGAQFYNVACGGWGGNTTGFIGVKSIASRWWGLSEDGCGTSGFLSLPPSTPQNKDYIIWGFFGDNATLNFSAGTNSNVECFGCQFGIAGTGAACSSGATVSILGLYHGFGDQIFNGGAGGASAAFDVNGGTAYLDGEDLQMTGCAAGPGSGVFVHGGGKVYAVNSTFRGGTTNGGIARQDTGTFFDGGGNSIITNASTSIVPTCAMTTGGGTGPACALVAGSSNEKGTVRMTPGTTPGATGTTTITFAGVFSGTTGTTPACTFSYANTGTGAWSLTTTTPIVMTTRSTTVPVFNWNQTGALTAASTYDVDYVCTAR